MKQLEMNPQSFDIEMSASDLDPETKDTYGSAKVRIKLGEESCETVLNIPELEKMGKWLLALAKKLGPKK